MEWTAAGAEAANKHLAASTVIAAEIASDQTRPNDADEATPCAKCTRPIFDVTNGVDSFGFNAAIAKLYAFTNTLGKSTAGADAKRQARKRWRSSWPP